jgi:hypothetical protein
VHANTKLYAEDQVRDGVAFLNEQVPGWRTRINLQVLDLRNNEDCILGQLFGSYEEGTHALGLSPAWASLLGFFRHDNRNSGSSSPLGTRRGAPRTRLDGTLRSADSDLEAGAGANTDTNGGRMTVQRLIVIVTVLTMLMILAAICGTL